MRIYKRFPEALSEIRRDMKEMGIPVHTQTYQDKYIGDIPEMQTLELQNYVYTVTEPFIADLNPTQPWAAAEFRDRVTSPGLNPGTAWEMRPEVWTQFLHSDGRFGYTYSERINQLNQIDEIIQAIEKDPNSRQLFMSIWDPGDIQYIGGDRRVPCTLGYHFLIRREKLNITYLQRSADLATHFENDIYLAHRMQHYIAEATGYEVGNYTHWVGSLHVFKKDVKGVF